MYPCMKDVGKIQAKVEARENRELVFKFMHDLPNFLNPPDLPTSLPSALNFTCRDRRSCSERFGVPVYYTVPVPVPVYMLRLSLLKACQEELSFHSLFSLHREWKSSNSLSVLVRYLCEWFIPSQRVLKI